MGSRAGLTRRRRALLCCTVLGGALGLLAVTCAYAQTASPQSDDRTYLESDTLTGLNGHYTATGNVEMRRQDRTIRADNLDYDTNSAVVQAAGKVRIYQPDGSAAFADTATFNSDLTQGAATGFSAVIPPHSKIAAATAIRRSATLTEMNRVIFTACDICRENGKSKTPSWSISASHVVRDEQAQAIYYSNAIVRIKGVPVFYSPIFSQADPEAVRRSGLLQPRFQQTKRRGLSYEQPYLWSISPYQDLIINPQINTDVRPFLNLDYRKRFYSGSVRARLGYTYEQEFNNDGVKFGPDRSKAYILASGLFQIEPHWTWGFAAERARDRLLFDQYSIPDVDDHRGLFFSDDRRLLSQIYTVRQSDRSYLSVSALSFQSLRPVPGSAPNAFGIRPLEDDQTLPVVAPLIEFRYEPEDRIAGGRLRIAGSGVLLARDVSPTVLNAPGIDSRRATAEADWRGSLTLNSGIRFEPFLMARGDLYNVADLSAVNTGAHTTGRALGVAGVDASWPFIHQSGGMTTILEPIVQIAVSPDVNVNPNIPNEDSVAFDFDATNLFEPNKFTGFDLYEGGQRVNVGVRSTLDWGDGRAARLIVGRSFRADPDPMFQPRTSLNQTSSDWVVGGEITPVKGMSVFARARLDGGDFEIRKIEAGADVNLSRGSGYIRYMREDQDFAGVPREDIEGAGEVFVTKYWGVSADAVRDLETSTWRRRAAGIVYKDECMRFDILYQRDDNPLLGARSSQSIVLRLTLATLGDAGYRNYATGFRNASRR